MPKAIGRPCHTETYSHHPSRNPGQHKNNRTSFVLVAGKNNGDEATLWRPKSRLRKVIRAEYGRDGRWDAHDHDILLWSLGPLFCCVTRAKSAHYSDSDSQLALGLPRLAAYLTLPISRVLLGPPW